MLPVDVTNSPEGAVVVELKKQSRKRIRRFRKNMEGKLADTIQHTLEALRTSGKIGENVQPVVFVVRQKVEPGRIFSW
jgi:hypothetical protein